MPDHITKKPKPPKGRPKGRPRGRPKGSKSKSKKTIKRCQQQDNDINAINQPQRKKRKVNKSHRQAYPDQTDKDIRIKLALERKEKNRKSAQESRERRKKQDEYLTDRIPKGIKLKNHLIDLNKKVKVCEYAL